MYEAAYKHLQSQILFDCLGFITFFKPVPRELRLSKLTKIEVQSFNK